MPNKAGTNSTIREMLLSIYRKLGLYPLLAIQLVLIVVYFVAMSLFGQSARSMMFERVQSQMRSIAQTKSARIETSTGKVYSATELFQKEYTRIFANPGSFPIPKPPAIFTMAPNGVTYKPIDNGGSYVWYSAITPQGPEQQRKRLFTEAIDPFAKNLMKIDSSIAAIYLNTYDSMCRYYPYRKDVWKWAGYVPNMRIPTFNFYYLADAKHNPSRDPVWTRAYLDPAGQGWMVSCIAPVYRGGFLEGVAGIDITIERIISHLFSDELPYGSQSMLVDGNGTILAMPGQVATWLGLKEMTGHRYINPVTNNVYKPDEYNLLSSSQGEVAQSFRPMLTGQTDIGEVTLKGKPFVLATSEVNGTGWQVVTIVERNVIYKPLEDIEKRANMLGATAFTIATLLTVAVSLLLHVRSRQLAQQISAPIEQLAAASTAMAKGQGLPALGISGISEVDLLSRNFSRMAKVLLTDATKKQIYTSRLKQVHELTSDPELSFDQKQRQLLVMIKYEMDLQSVTLVQQQAKGLEAVCSAGVVPWSDGSSVVIDGLSRSDGTEVSASLMNSANQPFSASKPVLWIPYMVDGMVTGGMACQFKGDQNDAEASELEILQMLAQWYGYERERQEAESRRRLLLTNLQAVNKELSEFAYVASHDLKSPLRSISSLADWLVKDYSHLLDEQGVEILDLLVGRVRKMHLLVEAVLNYARVGRTHEREELVDLDIMVRDLHHAVDSDNRHRLDIRGTLPKLWTSRTRLEQIFQNLLENAVKYMDKEHGLITVACEEVGDMYEFAIEDNGPGIEAKYHDQIFHIFRTLTSRSDIDSSGIGLAQVKKIVELYGGKIWVQSDVGHGATFRFRIPRKAVAQPVESRSGEPIQKAL